MTTVHSLAASPLDAPDALYTRFRDLTAFLSTHRGLWSARPFVSRQLPWMTDHPEVARWLLALPKDTVRHIDQNPSELPNDTPPAFRTWADAALRLVELPRVERVTLIREKRTPAGISDRKWRQVNLFLNGVLAQLPDHTEHAIDWCAGKGHLGRTFSEMTQLPVTLLERRHDLCQTGEALAARRGRAQITFQILDVMHAPADLFDGGTVGLGLHACGILWRTLLDRTADAEAPAAFVAPCCYHHLGGDETYRPQSEAGRAQDLGLSQANLRLAMAEEIIARPAVRRARHREQVFRLGLDRLVRSATGQDEYLRQGKLPAAVLRLPFVDFCHEAASRMGVPLPRTWSPSQTLRYAVRRSKEVYALGQVRALFRRPMELWLVLDAALAQIERGRTVRIRIFCDRNETPRNILLASFAPPIS